MNINTVAVTGNLTRDPESFSAGCNLGVAVNDREKVNDEWQDRPSFFDVVVFGKQGDACQQYLQKGSPVAVQGKLRQDRWTNDNGDNRSKVKVVAFAVQFLGSRENGDGSKSDAPPDDGDFTKDLAADHAQQKVEPSILPAGTIVDNPQHIAKYCTCPPNAKSDLCPIQGHGIPF